MRRGESKLSVRVSLPRLLLANRLFSLTAGAVTNCVETTIISVILILKIS